MRPTGGTMNLEMFSAVAVVDAPRLKLFGIRYAMAGLAKTRADALDSLGKAIKRRNKLAPLEKMRLIPESMVFPASMKVREERKLAVLKTIPKGFAAMELCKGSPGLFMNRSIESLLRKPEAPRNLAMQLGY